MSKEAFERCIQYVEDNKKITQDDYIQLEKDEVEDLARVIVQKMPPEKKDKLIVEYVVWHWEMLKKLKKPEEKEVKA